jgi:FMN phosphatase YigB (HAD superfamily)
MSNTILPHALPCALDDASASCAVLSLDCFDTLLWRTTHSPGDVFQDIGSAGGNSQQRRWAETDARSRAALRRRSNEVAIAEIYDMLLPDASLEAREAGVAAELAAEARHCFAFGPTVELIRQAKRRGLKVIIVSDTYLSRDQLDWLITTAAGPEVRTLIDRIFCSSEFGKAKAEGLFSHVLQQMGVRPENILHLGDNLVADFQAPQRLNIPARHLVQFCKDTEQRLRMEAAASALLHAGTRECATYQLHRAAVAVGEPRIPDRATMLGYSVLGPVLAAFDVWLRAEVQVIQTKTPGRVHLHFLMRDGYLPLAVHRAVGALDDVQVAAVEVSRYTAIAAGLTSIERIERFLGREAGAGDYAAVARQLLFDRREAAALLGNSVSPQAQRATFLANVRKSANTRKILSRSAALRERLIRHVQNATNPQPGDTVVLVDLGYAGTVQNWIEPVLRAELRVEVAGRYLLLREQERSACDKRGLLDARHYDPQALSALCGNVAAIEQLSTVAQGSVIEYLEDGTPVRAENGIKGRQSETRTAVQQGCVRFAAEWRGPVTVAPSTMALDQERRGAAAALARFMFLPQAGEVEVLRQFDHDINLGGGETVPLFDGTLAQEELRRQGMFYIKNAERMYLPAELQPHGLPLSLSFFAQRRFDLDLQRVDLGGSRLTVPIIVADGREVTTTHVEAHSTHDGFFAATIPVGRSQYAIGVQLGRLYEWVEVQAATFEPAPGPGGQEKCDKRPPIAARPSYEGIDPVSSNLMHCIEPTGFMMVPPPPASGDAMILTVVFRPITARQSASHPAQRPATVTAGVSS